MDLKEKVVYQIYPMSFMDSNNDGMGDIRGIISKIPYLKELGVDMIWLTPMYVSPKNDNGYDVQDYYNIDPLFGTMEDMDELISTGKQNNIGLIMDIVANHTSTEHIWFKKALKGEQEYIDYYVFRDKKYVESHPFESIFGGDAWEYAKELDLYYLHNFDKTQADLNWDNVNVRENIYKILNFWLEKGIEGFRFDVIDMISKDLDKGQMSNGPNLHLYIKEMNKRTFGGKNILTVGETWSADTLHAKEYSNPNGSEFSMVFTFEHIMFSHNKWETRIDRTKLRDIFSKYQTELHNKGWNSLFLNNHDLPRLISRYGDHEHREITGKQWAIILHLMEGTPFIYQGEEIGMTNREWKKEEIRDVEALNYYNSAIKFNREEEIIKNINNVSRDNARTPMQWDSSEYAGFSNSKPWIVTNENYLEINVQKALNTPDSIFYTYKKLIEFRKNLDVITKGDFKLVDINTNFFAYTREYNGEKLTVISNWENKEESIEFVPQGKLILGNYTGESINYRPYETRVFLDS